MQKQRTMARAIVLFLQSRSTAQIYAIRVQTALVCV